MASEPPPSDGPDNLSPRKFNTYPFTPIISIAPGGLSSSDIAVVGNALADQNEAGHSSPVVSKYEGSAHTGASLDQPQWTPMALEWWSTIGLGLTFILVAVSSEVLLMYSQKNSGFGFHIDLTNTELSRGRQFAKSYGASILFGPLFFWFGRCFTAMELLQPYVEMSKKGGALGQDSVFVNYLLQIPLFVYIWTLTRRQLMLCVLSSIAFATGFFYSLAASFFQIIPVSLPGTILVDISGNVGLGYNLSAYPYAPFVIAAGGLDEAFRAGALSTSNIYPYDTGHGFWMVPSLNLHNSGTSFWNGNVTGLSGNVTGLSGNMTGWSSNATVELSAAGIQAACAAAQSIDVTGPNAQDSYQIVGTLPNKCSATSTVNQTNGWFGWAVLAPFACVHGINPNEPVVADTGEFYHPAALVFFKNTSAISMVFCYSTIVEHKVTINGAFSSNDHLGINHLQDNGFVGSLGLGPSGLSFNETGINVAITGTLTDGILQSAGDLQNEVFSNSSLAVGYVQTSYLMYQALLAPLTLVVGPAYVKNATSETPTLRILATEPVAHLLTILCSFTGITLFVLFLHHPMRRHAIRLGAEPSGIAAIAALLSKSTFLQDLDPRDDIQTIVQKLRTRRFELLENGGIDYVKAPPEEQA